MGIEGGSFGGRGGGVGSGLGIGGGFRGGVGVGIGRGIGGGIEGARAASVSGSSFLFKGPTFEAAPVLVGPIREGPAKVSFGELRPMITNDKPIDNKGGSLNPLGEIKFNSPREPIELNVADAILEAESIIKQVQAGSVAEIKKSEVKAQPLKEEQVVQEFKHGLGLTALIINGGANLQPGVEPKLAPFLVPVVEPAKEQPQAEVKPDTKGVIAILKQPQEGIADETGVTPSLELPKVLPAADTKKPDTKIAIDQPENQKNELIVEDVEELKAKDVFHEEVYQYRVESELNPAIEKAESERIEQGEEVIDGKDITRHVPGETRASRSGIIKDEDVPDGGRVEALETIGSRKYISVDQAKADTKAVLKVNEPVKKAQYGQDVPKKSVDRVRKFQLIKGGRPTELIEKRINQKKVLKRIVPIAEVIQISTEARLEDYPDLAEALAPKLAA